MRNSLKILLPLAVLAAGAVGAVLLVKAAPEAETVEPTTPPPLVRVVEAARRDVRLDVTTQGTVAPRTEATLVAQVAGRIVRVSPAFAEGGAFRAGEMLVRIDPTDYELAVSQAEARVAQAETALARTEAEAAVAREEWEELHPPGPGGEATEPNPLAVREPQLAEARAALESARAQLDQARVNLARTTVQAPFDGRVRRKEADVGQSVTPGTPLGRVFATDYAEVRLPVPVAELGYLDVDLSGAMEDGPETVLAAELAGARRTWPARIVRTAGAIDADTRMLGLVARVDRPLAPRPEAAGGAGATPLPMGLFVEATITGRRAEGVFVLPRAALREAPGQSGALGGDPARGASRGLDRKTGHVLVVEPGTGGGEGGTPDRLRFRLHFREVQLLRLTGDRAVISAGLDEGERIAVSPLDAPVDGMAVRVAPDAAAADGEGDEGMNRWIAWFAENRVAANLLMVLILGGGILTLFTLRQEVFPEVSSDMISVTVPYPGAAPEEVEDGVVTRVEDAIEGIEGIQEVTSTANEGLATVRAELLESADVQRVLADVKSQVDAIASFPEEAEEPIIQELILRRQVINVAVSGSASERTLKEIGQRIRDDLAATPGITQADLAVARPYEISVEVSERTLRRYGLTFDHLAAAVRAFSLDLPGGSVETEGGEILVRTEGQAYRGEEFERLPLLTRPDGSRLLLGDVARVVDGFADTDQAARFDGEPAVLVKVFRVGEQDALEVADTVKSYVARKQAELPEGIALTLWQDDTEILKSRRDLLVRNGLMGFALVFLVLALFLRLRLAGWVALGIPISFLGGFWLMPGLDVTVNMISLFAFIVVLGIVVDDAIVVGENIYTHYQRGAERLRAAVPGAQEVAVPVTFAVLTTVAAFSPLLAVPGNTGKFMRVVPLIVIPVLLFSLVECLLILPAHLSHLRHEGEPGSKGRPLSRISRAWRSFQDAFARGLDRVIHRSYAPSLEWALEWRYLALALGLAALLLLGGVVAGGWIQFTFLPDVEADNVVALLEMPRGTPAERTAEAVRRLEETARELQRELESDEGGPVFEHLLASIGQQPFRTQQSQGHGSVGDDFSGAHLGEVNIQLVGSEEREIDSERIAELWRQRTGPIADAVALTFSASLFSVGEDVNVQLTGPDLENLQAAAERVKDELRRYPGVTDITDSFRAGKQEVEVELTDEGAALGLTLADLARQVRHAFYGAEAQRIQRGREEVKVMVRYPEAERRSLGALEELRIRLPGATGAIPFSTAARATMGRGFASIQRVDRHRTVNVTAAVNEETANANEVLARLESEGLPRALRDVPDVSWSFEGQQEEQRETLSGLARGFAIAMLVIFILLAIPFRSYFQPLIIMAAVPFGMIGAVLGHLLMGQDLTILSFFGIVALTGVVVNDSLIMVDFINRAYRTGTPLHRSIREAGMARFRPILLTSLTTFAGLTPLLLEQSLQAQFLIPMAISLAFGVLFATSITLILVPVLYAIYEDVKGPLTGTAEGGESRRDADEELPELEEDVA